jgi:hypothetical protein
MEIREPLLNSQVAVKKNHVLWCTDTIAQDQEDEHNSGRDCDIVNNDYYFTRQSPDPAILLEK